MTKRPLDTYANRARLAAAFCSQLHEDLGADAVDAINETNENDGINARTCATHDVCDANMVMWAAFETAFGVAPLLTDDDAPEDVHHDETALWDAAWTLAKVGRFALHVINTPADPETRPVQPR